MPPQAPPQRLLGADTFDRGMGRVTSGQLPNLLDAFVAAFGDHVGGSELLAEVGAVGVAAHQDDLVCSILGSSSWMGRYELAGPATRPGVVALIARVMSAVESTAWARKR